VLLTVEIGSEREVLDSLREILGVKEAYQISSVYDLIIRVEAERMQELRELINRIRGIGKIRSMLTLGCV